MNHDVYTLYIPTGIWSGVKKIVEKMHHDACYRMYVYRIEETRLNGAILILLFFFFYLFDLTEWDTLRVGSKIDMSLCSVLIISIEKYFWRFSLYSCKTLHLIANSNGNKCFCHHFSFDEKLFLSISSLIFFLSFILSIIPCFHLAKFNTKKKNLHHSLMNFSKKRHTHAFGFFLTFFCCH